MFFRIIVRQVRDTNAQVRTMLVVVTLRCSTGPTWTRRNEGECDDAPRISTALSAMLSPHSCTEHSLFLCQLMLPILHYISYESPFSWSFSPENIIFLA